MSSKGLQITARVLDFGPIPPSGGPSRLRYLDVNGRKALQTANDELAAVVEILGRQQASIPVMHVPIVDDDNDARAAVQREKRAEWAECIATSDLSLMAAIEPHIRSSEASAVAALNFLEDHELAETAHHAIHRAAFIRRGLFGCPISLRDNAFWTDCSIKVSHLRVGMSAGLTGDFECSICGSLFEDCDHTGGETYDKVAAKASDGNCTICESRDCAHIVGTAYPTVACATGRNMVPEEVSIVARPRYPQARITEMTMHHFRPDDSPRHRWGAEHGYLNCDFCLGPCRGFDDMTSLGLGS